ncbi:MAG: helix-hairpin-helix domain-containing protein [Myxococcota bacterium]
MIWMALLACETPEEPEKPAEPAAVVEKAPEAPAAAPEAAPAQMARVNLNEATEDELKAIPGITAKLVHEFEEYRPYVSIQQFRKEIGKYIDAEAVTAFEAFVYVPIDPNKCDEATFMQIDGLSEEGAKTLVAGRPYADLGAFDTALSPHVAPESVKQAISMVTGF